MGKFGGKKFDELTLFEHLAKNVWQIYRLAKRSLIASTSLDGFSLMNHRHFANSPNFPAIR